MNDYNKLLEFCNTPTQIKRLKAIIKHGSHKKAGKALGVDRRRISETVAGVKKLAAKKGYFNGLDVSQYVPESTQIKGTSTYTTLPNGDKMWVKTDAVKERNSQEWKEAMIEELQEYKGASLLQEPPKYANEDILCVMPIGDQHVGVLSWFDETGHNYDLKIAQQEFDIATRRMIEAAPPAHTCIIMDMGDFLHAQDNKNTTPNSSNALDCDGRSMKRKRVAVNMLIKAVEYACQKFKKVVVRNVLGNHSPEGEQALALMLALFFSNNPQVQVDASPNKFWYYRFGQVLLGAHHGDKIKKNELPLIMATDVPELWGATKYRYFLMGHIHHESVKEYQGCSVESFNTLAGSDAWHHASGYRSRQNIKLITYHKDYGEIERSTKDIAMIRDSLLNEGS